MLLSGPIEPGEPARRIVGWTAIVSATSLVGLGLVLPARTSYARALTALLALVGLAGVLLITLAVGSLPFKY